MVKLKESSEKRHQIMIFKPTLSEIAKDYKNTSESNDKIHALFTSLTNQDPLLNNHRQYIEKNKLGFEDTAFHSMWARIIELVVDRFKNVRALEIGVFKGQVISLWSLLGSKNSWPLEISAISPFEGDPLPPSKIKIFFLKFNKKFRDKIKIGEFYPKEDYLKIIKNTFSQFGLPFEEAVIYKGLSSDKKVLSKLENEKYEIIYIDEPALYSEELANKKILIAEDQQINLMMIARMLKKYNIEVDSVENGQELVKMFKDNIIGENSLNKSKYDLILTDINMPVLSGLEAAKLIRQIEKDHKIIHKKIDFKVELKK